MTYGHCRRGGMNGFRPSAREMREASEKMFPGAKYWDTAIPLGHRSPCSSHDRSTPIAYWERPDGGHGWACRRCGQVLQWG